MVPFNVSRTIDLVCTIVMVVQIMVAATVVAGVAGIVLAAVRIFG